MSSAPERDELPVDSLRDAIPHLRRPFTPEAVKFKVQTVFKEQKGCIVVAYIDARLVIERLNRVIPDQWAASYTLLDGGKLMWCHLTVGVTTRSDVGESPKGMSKDLVSDALKRAAVHFGIGVSIYALPQITLYLSDAKFIEKRGSSLALTEKGHVKLREGYTRWLEREDHGFGAPLDHGDVEGATVDEDAEAEQEFAPTPPPALEDAEAIRLTEEARALYDRLDKRDLPPARFNAWLTGAAYSHEELRKLVDHLEERAAKQRMTAA